MPSSRSDREESLPFTFTAVGDFLFVTFESIVIQESTDLEKWPEPRLPEWLPMTPAARPFSVVKTCKRT